MSLKSRQLGSTKFVKLNTALTLTGTPTTNAFGSPFGQTVALLQNAKLTEWVSTGEVLRPLGVQVQATTTITVTNPILTLQKAVSTPTGASSFASASSGGVATSTLLAAGSAQFFPFTDYVGSDGISNFVADAAGDQWRLSVTTSPTAGAADLGLHYVNIGIASVSDAVTTL